MDADRIAIRSKASGKMALAKKVFSWLVLLLLVAGIVPAGFLAANLQLGDGAHASSGSGGIGTSEVIALPTAGDPADYPEYPNEGYVRMTKASSWTNEAETKAKIEFSVWGEPKVTGADIVLVMDNSNSMDDDIVGDYNYCPIDGVRLTADS
ncbi:MAG: hypothetical protein LBJ10_05695, partial [Clostridiales bacterium]|nr:hypothetical protein [Clostridiales bacterium]